MRAFTILVAVLALPVAGFCATIHVPGDFPTIQEAIDASVNGDTVLVASGTYVEHIDFKGKAITVISDQGPEVTVIDGNGMFSSVVTCQSGEGPDSVLDGFTITNGSGTYDPDRGYIGGGMYNYQSNPTVNNCTFSGNGAWFGGGMYNYQSNPTVTGCTLSENEAHGKGGDGGGMYNDSSNPTVTDCTFSKNVAIHSWGGWFPGSGGGMCNDQSNPTVTDCTFSENVSSGGPLSGGGGMSGGLVGSSGTVTNCTFIGNTAVSGGGMYGDGTVTNCTFIGNTAVSNSGGMYGDGTVTNCILWGNQPDQINGDAIVSFCCVQGGYPGTGNIDSAPLFFDPTNGDFHLSCLSPCVDTGDNNAPALPDFDFEGDPRIIDGDGDGMAVVDMGADEVVVLLVPSDYPTIQSAIDAVSEGASILVEPGTYYENIDFIGKAIAVAGKDGHEHTVIDGCQTGSVVTFQSGDGRSSSLAGFQIMNGCATNGGGILCIDASPFLRNNHIHDNAALYGDGGGIYCLNADPLIEDNLVSTNTADNGGGIYCYDASPVIIENTITVNTAGIDGAGVMCLECDDVIISGNVIKDNKGTDNGGGIHCLNADPLIEDNLISYNTADNGGGIHCHLSSPLIRNNKIDLNTAENGGGICCLEASPVMVNNVLSDNQASTGGAISTDDYSSPIITNNTLYSNSASSTGGGLDCSSGSSVITNSIFWNNEAPTGSQICGTSPLVTYCDVQEGWPGYGNIDADPLFVDPDGGDFHLSLDSPCANVGYNYAPELPEGDFEGDPRIFVIVDMGVDETGFGGGVKIYVPMDYPTIQSAIDVAMEDNTVFVSPGTYFENLDFLGKAITVKGAAGHELTVIDGSQVGSVVVFANGEDLNAVLEGFQIVNGSATNGGGILCQGASPTLRNNDIWGNSATKLGMGGGIYCDQSSPMISDNLIRDNSAHVGGGICCDEASPIILNNSIFNNSAQFSGNGGGICCTGSLSQPVISNNTITKNTSYWGGGISSIFEASPVVTNTILWGNQAMFWLGPEISVVATVEISYSDVQGGIASVHLEPGYTLDWGDGMIDEDPLFVDPENEDFHLTSLSPCINRGANDGASSEDIDGDGRPFMGTVDMGSDEYTGIHPLEADVFSVSEATGGKVHFTLDGGLANAGRYYVVLGSLSGTAPGAPLPGDFETLRLNWDVFTDFVFLRLNTPAFIDFFGTLNLSGQAAVQLNAPPIPGLADTTMHYAYCLSNSFDFVSNPVAVEIVP